MFKIVIFFITLSVCVFRVQADNVYLSPSQFINQQFLGNPPKAKVIWLKKDLKAKINSILQHQYAGLRVRYWQEKNQSVWILNEIGKEKNITVGITIVDAKIKLLKVLVFRESRGWEVKYDFFTNQFLQLFITDEHQLNESIDSISGATLSVRAVEKLAKIALLLANETSTP